MTAPPERLSRAAQQARTRLRLLEASAAVIAEQGLDAATIDDITERAGYSRGAFYSNFRDKVDLLIALSDHRLDAFAADTLPQLLTGPPDTQLAAVAGWLAGEDTPLEVLLVVELARQRLRRPDRATELTAAIARVLESVQRLHAGHDDQVASTPPEEQAARARAVLAAVLGADLLRHLDIPVDARTLELLLGGAVGPAEAPR